MNNLNIKRLRSICQDLKQAEMYIHTFLNEEERVIDWTLDTESKKELSYFNVSQQTERYFRFVYFNVEFSIFGNHQYVEDGHLFNRQKDLFFHLCCNNKNVVNFCDIYSLPYFKASFNNDNYVFGNFKDLNVAASIFKNLLQWWLNLGNQIELPELDIF